MNMGHCFCVPNAKWQEVVQHGLEIGTPIASRKKKNGKLYIANAGLNVDSTNVSSQDGLQDSSLCSLPQPDTKKTLCLLAFLFVTPNISVPIFPP